MKRSVMKRIAIAGCLLLSACAAGPDFERPQAPGLAQYAATADATAAAQGIAQRFLPQEEVDAQWWRLFGSPALNEAVAQALAGNASLQAAQANLRASEANLRAGQGVFAPSVDLGFSAVRERASPLRLGINAVSGIFNLYTLSASVGYALDLSGGQRRSVEALGAQRDYSAQLRQATYLALTGNVVNTLIARAAYAAQIAATEELIARQREQLQIARAQADGGTAPYSSALAIAGQLAASRASLASLRQKADAAAHLFASLCGAAPAERSAPVLALDALVLPADLPLSLPSQLVRQRPDILQAEALLHVASANIGVATAALLPSVNLSGSFGWNNTTLGGLTDANAKFWSIGPAVGMPVFHGGTLIHRREAATEAFEKAQADYRQTVINAFAQVADVLSALEHDAQALAAQNDALDDAREALKLVQANYRAGLVGYVDVLIANAQLQQSQINRIAALAQRFQDTTALYLALGGGWWNEGESR
jgi:NodT family efflux transporter outer membrane factor (OMF) lipoprotein